MKYKINYIYKKNLKLNFLFFEIMEKYLKGKVSFEDFYNELNIKLTNSIKEEILNGNIYRRI